MRTRMKRMFALLLVCCMCLSAIPGYALDAGGGEKEVTIAAPEVPSPLPTSTPAANAPEEGSLGSGLTNVALDKLATASGSESGTPFTPDKAVDGVVNRDALFGADQSRWSTERDTAEAWFMVDLGAEYEVQALKLAWERDNVTEYSLLLGTTQAELTPVTAFTSGPPGLTQALQLDEAVTARYVKLLFTEITGGAKDWPSVSLYEVEVYAPQLSQDSDAEAPALLAGETVPPTVEGENLAFHKTATSNGDETSNFSAAKATDGDPSTRWASTASVSMKWLAVDFGVRRAVKKLVITWERRNATDYQIQVSENGTDWTDATHLTEAPGQKRQIIVLPDGIEGQYLRVLINQFDSNSDGADWPTVSIFELEAYATNIALPDEVLTQFTVEKGAKTLELPTIPGGTLTYIGTDYEQVIGADQTVYAPLVDTNVTVSVKLTKGAVTQTYDVPTLVKGTAAENTGNTAPKVSPELREWVGASGSFRITENSRIVLPTAHKAALQGMAEAFAADYLDLTGNPLTIAEGNAPGTGDFYMTLGSADAGLGDEGYRMTIANGVSVEATGVTGAYWATRTILQILKQTGTTLPKGQTRDYPKFPVRGLVLDVGRKAFPQAFLENLVQNMAWYKMNDLQLHLNDNYIFLADGYVEQGNDPMSAYSGFRLESGITGADGQALTSTDTFYTKAWFNDFVTRASALGINIVPEFDSPAHSLAFTKVRPDLAMDGAQCDHLDLINQFDESVTFIKSVFDEYITGSDPTFPSGSVVHVGTDEYNGDGEAFLAYMQEMFQHVAQKGYTVRAWGSITSALTNGGTEASAAQVPVDNVQLNMWYPGYGDPKDMYNRGYGLINTQDSNLYIVPGANYYHDYLNTEHLYQNWSPYNMGGSFLPPAGSTQMLGAAFACWNDMTDVSAVGLSTLDVYDRIAAAIPTLAEKTWGEAETKTYTQLTKLADTLGAAPNSNPRMELPSKNTQANGAIAAYPMEDGADLSGNGYAIGTLTNASYVSGGKVENALELKGGASYGELSVGTGGPGSVEFWVKLDTNAQGEQILFESDKGAIKAVQKDTGMVGFSREEYDYSFSYTLPKNQWVRLRLSSELGTAKLYVNGTLTSTLTGHNVNSSAITTPADWYATMYLPLDRVGSKTHALQGKLDQVIVYRGVDAPPTGVLSGGETLSVRFDSNGGSAVADVVAERGGVLTQPTPPTRAGYVLNGWYPDKALTQPWDFATDVVTQAITLYAGWIPYTPSNAVRTTNFDKGWLFQLSATGDPAGKDYDDSAWRGLTLPHDWSIEQDFTNSVSSEIGHLPGGTGWYRKHFTLPADMAGKRVSLDFDGVYMDSYLYVNGQMVGNYPNGYLPFSFDISDYVVCDGKTENVVAVKVTNITTASKQSSRWYSGSGIYRDVYLTVTEPVHVAQYGTVLRTPNLAQEHSGVVNLEATTTVQNESDQAVNARVRTSLLTYENEAEAATPAISAEVVVPAHGTAELPQTIPVNQPALWSVEHPNLYLVKTEILVDGVVTDTYETRFGFKWAEFDKDAGFSLNGEWRKLYGVCMHHDQGALGAVGNASAIQRQMQKMKDMGVNSIRVTHNPASPELMRICDELGLMVIEEAFDTWYNGKNANDYGRFFEKKCTYPSVVDQNITWAQFDLQQMIRRNRNSPSVILWSLGNEIWETADAKGVETAKKLIQWAKAIDTDHPITMGEDKFRMNAVSTGNFIEVAKLLDVVGMNYAESNYDYYRTNFPDWIIYGAETSSAIKSRGYYSDPAKQTGASTPLDYQLSSYDNLAVGWGKTATNSWVPDRDRKNILGEFIWTGFDYIGEPTPWNQSFSAPPKSSYFGIVDTAGFPKDDYYLYQSQWLDVGADPMVHLFPHWNWENEALRSKVTVEGKIPLRVYSNAPKVELFVDGVSQGEKAFAQKTTSDGRTYQQMSDSSNRLYLEWPLVWNYVVGTTLVAKAKDASGKVIATDTIVTAGAAAKVELNAERSVMQADGTDLAYIAVDITDADGTFMPTAMNQVTFQISGNGTIVGVDNGDAASWERYKDTNGAWERSAFNGKALVIVQSSGEAGSFTLTASSKGLSSDSVTVYAKDSGASEDTILGYESVRVTTNVGIQPELPATVLAILAGGGKVEKTVTWDAISQETLSKPGIYTLKGTVAGGASVTLTLTVRGVSGVKDVSIVTPVGKIPTLPATVIVLWSDGGSEQKNVTWSAITQQQVAKAGSFTVTGTIANYPSLSATAKVRVTDQQERINVARDTNGTQVEASYSEGVHTSAQAIDGVVNATGSEANGWGNYDNPRRTDDSLTLTFKEPYAIREAKVWIEASQSWQTPDTITLQYWDGTRFVNVENQSKTTDFVGRASKSDTTYEGNAVTFDEVTTSKLRFQFHINAYASGKDMMKIAETAVYADVLIIGKDATLSDLTLDGKTVVDFSSGTLDYSHKLPYLDAVPTVGATLSDPNATITIRQAMDANSAAVVEVTAEDATTTSRYTVQFLRNAPILKSVTLGSLGTVTQDDTPTLSATGLMEDGEAAPAGATVVYTVQDKTGHAEIRSGKLYAYDAGTVTLTASMTWQGVTVASAPLTLTIQKNPKEKHIVSFEPLTVKTVPKQAPELPGQVTAIYDQGLPRALAVVWDKIEPEQYATQNRFLVNGTVTETTLRPSVMVEVVDVLAVESVSMAVPKGYTPELPEELTVFFSDGSSRPLAATWPKPLAPAMEGTTKIEGSVTFAGTTHKAIASVRAADSTQSPNYVIVRNGYDLPIGIASYTNDALIESSSKDSAANLNDGTASFSLSANKQIWCNWKRGTQNVSDWVSAILASEGLRVARTVDTVKIGYIDEGNPSSGIRVPQSYQVEYYTGPMDYEINLEKKGHVSDWNDSPLNNPANWHEVTYVSKPDVPARESFAAMQTILFQPVKTSLIRVNMNAYSGFCLGVNELEVYGSSATANTTIGNASILVDGVDRTSDFVNGALTIDRKDASRFPSITATAENNAAVTVVSATLLRPTATVRIVPEDGGQAAIKTYTITFTWPDQVDRTALNNAIAEAQALIRTDYTNPSWTALQLALESARLVAGAAEATQEEVDTAQKALSAAIKALVRVSGDSGNGGGGRTTDSETTVDANGNRVTTTTDKATGNKTIRVIAPDGSQSQIKVKGDTITGTTTLSQKATDAAGEGVLLLPVAGVSVSKVCTPTLTVTLPQEKPIRVAISAEGLQAGSVAILVGKDGRETVVRQSVTKDGTLLVPLNGSAVIRIENREPSFGDVPSGWMSDPVAFAYSHELMSGSGTAFQPETMMTRAMLATVLYRFANEPATDASLTFDDVPGDSYYADAVAWAAKEGVITGGSGGFQPEYNLTREQLAAMLYRYMGTELSRETTLPSFADATHISPWATEAMQWAVACGILTGKGGAVLDPQGNATRAEVAAMLMRFALV